MIEHTRGRKTRKTLRQALRDLLRRHKTSPTPIATSESALGSGILRRASSRVPQLPNISSVSVLPDFSTHHNAIRCQPSTPPSKSLPGGNIRHETRLLPQTSLSNLRLGFKECKSIAPQNVVYHSVPELYQRGASRQASIVDVTRSSKQLSPRSQSHSSLRVRSSNRHTRQQSTISTGTTSGEYKVLSKTQQGTHIGIGPQSSPGVVMSAYSTRTLPLARPLHANRTPLQMIDHFNCFVVLDTSENPCPVTGTSSDLRHIFELGEQYHLNVHHCEESSIDIISGQDAAGEELVWLVLYAPLLIPGSGRHRYVLVSLLEVTDFIRENATHDPELDSISEVSSVDEVATPPQLTQRDPRIWSDYEYHLSADDLLGGCSLPVANLAPSRITMRDPAEDIWLTLAATENRSESNKTSTQASKSSSRASRTAQQSDASHVSDATDNILEEFMGKLQELYSQFFLLGRSPLAEAYEVCNISPKLYADRERVDEHLSQCSPDTLAYLGERLGRDVPFTTQVQWGTGRTPKQLYCSPLFTGSSITWVCYLVDEQMESLW